MTVADDLEAFLDSDWRERVSEASVHSVWARLQLLSVSHVRGLAGLRKSLRTNVQEVSVRHVLIQARLAAQGIVAGCQAVLEPAKADGNPGDLSLTRGATSVFLEIKTFNPDRYLAEPDQTSRLWRALDIKARQTRAAGQAWIWVQDNHALWPSDPFARLTLEAKLKTFGDLVEPLLDMHPHLVGVVLTSASLPGEPPASDETLSGSTGLGFVRGLPGLRRRESLIAHRGSAADQLDLVAGLCADEPLWLERASSRL